MTPLPPYSPDKLSENFTQVATLYQRVMQELMMKHSSVEVSPSVIDPLNISSAFAAIAAKIWADPEKLLKHQLDYTHNYLELLGNVTARFMGENLAPLYKTGFKDNRFRDAAWEENSLFNFIKQSYLMSAEWLQKLVHDVDGIDHKTARKVDFYTRQFIDALAPTNFAITNPEVLKATIETNGENLVRGLQNLLADLEKSKRHIAIKTTDTSAFKIGENLATAKGSVIFQNDLMQLIHYTPTCAETYKRPLLIIPPWINKYYILDMKPKNSFMIWLLEQGYSVFMVSWVNPGKELGHKNFEDYMLEGPLAALDAIEAATGEREVTAIGYCLGGTLLSATLSYMKAKQDNRIVAATFLTTLIDFSHAGELSIFIDEEQLQRVEERMNDVGYYDGSAMAATFSMLRANEMIWSFVINNYLLGKEPFPFDLLYWNSDSTHLPAKMHSFYLRNMYKDNKLVKPGGITLAGTPIDVRQIAIPCYLLSTREDHIAPWKGTYRTTTLFSGDTTFVLTASGHIAGVVNHPANQKYCYWTNPSSHIPADEWLKEAEEHKGSWWPHWHHWNQQHSGETIAAIFPGEGELAIIEAAPGSYVKVRYE